MRKSLKWIIKILIGVIILWFIIFGVDFYRCSHLKEPIFVLSRMEKLIAYSKISHVIV